MVFVLWFGVALFGVALGFGRMVSIFFGECAIAWLSIDGQNDTCKGCGCDDKNHSLIFVPTLTHDGLLPAFAGRKPSRALVDLDCL